MPEENESDDTIIERESADGHPYKSRTVPCDISLEILDYKNHEALTDVGSYETHHLYVRCKEISEKFLPFLDANPREPSVTSQVRNMQEELQDSPEDFVKKNNGLTLICDSIDFDESDEMVTISFSEDEGVCNGGHTYFAIQTLDAPLDDSATVRIEAIQLPDDLTGDDRRDQIVGIAQARNDNQSLHTSSEADYLGYYDPYKTGMANTQDVSWHEGDADAHSEAISAVHFIRLLYALDPMEYHHPLYNPGSDRHQQLVISPGNIHESWFDEMEDAMQGQQLIPMRHMIPLIQDMWKIRDHLAYTLHNADLSGDVGGDSVVIRRTSLYRNYIGNRPLKSLNHSHHDEGLDLPNTLETIFFGLFRSNVWRCRDNTGDIGMIGWFINPNTIWDRTRLSVLSQMSEYFQEADSDAWQFQRQASPYEKDLYTFGWEVTERQESPSHPQIVYEITDHATHTDVACEYSKYKKVDDEEDATHWYSIDGECTMQDLEEIRPDLGDDFSFYRYAGE